MTILFVGPFPPPISGQALAAKEMSDQLRIAGADLYLLDISRPVEGYHSRRQAVWQFISNFVALFRLSIRGRRDRWRCFYHLAHGGRGLTRDVFFLSLVLLLGRMPLAVQVHGHLTPQDFAAVPMPLRAILSRLLAKVEIAFGLTPHLAEELQDLWPKPSMTIFAVLGNGVRREFVDSEVLPLPDVRNGLRIAHIGSLCHTKGTDVVLQLLSEDFGLLASVDLVGPVRCEAVRLQLDGLRDKRVRWHPSLTVSEIRRVLDESHLLLLPSLTEGQPLAVLEAMARARLVIASRVGGVPDCLQNDSAQLVDPGDTRRIVQLLTLLKDSPSALASVGAANRAWLEDYLRDHEAQVDSALRLLGYLPRSTS